VTFSEPTWGQVQVTEFERIAVISPHFDDAAMGAGNLLLSYPGSTVVTVYASAPTHYPTPPSEWDALGGFESGDDVVALRRIEDQRAMDLLGADHIWMEFVDNQYLDKTERSTPAEVASSLETVLRALHPTAIFLPFGLGNPDHDVTHNAGLIVRESMLDVAWFCYEDHGYKHIPGLLSWRVSKLLRNKPWATPAMVPTVANEELKREAIWCYESQIPPLERDHALSERISAHVPEQFWRLADPPKGWEGLSELI